MAVEDGQPICLTAHEISVRFGGVVALDEVSIEFRGPAIVGLVGPNGSGKSTLMGVLSGLVRPGRGRVEIDGRDLTGKSPLRYAKQGIRRSFQTVRLTPTLTIRDNLLVGLSKTGPQDLRRAEDVAETFGFADYLKKWPSEVPAGVQRLVQVGSVVLTQPSVVLLDEPAAGLTDEEAGELQQVIRGIGRRALVIVVEHNMQLIYDLTSRVIALINGRVVADGPVSSVRENEQFRAAYLGLPPSGSASGSSEAGQLGLRAGGGAHG
jgi:ABC-type branched-subunit amino acid transport system ATPase component